LTRECREELPLKGKFGKFGRGAGRRDWARELRAMQVRRARTLLADVRERALAHSRVSEALGPASGGAVAARRVSGKFSGDTSPVCESSAMVERAGGEGGGVSNSREHCVEILRR